MLAKPAFRALVLTAVAGLPAALAGCGAKDAPNPTGVSTTSVNPDDSRSWDDFLKSIDVTPAPREELGTERASGKRGVFLIYPVGEIRKVGLKKFRIDVTSDFDAKGDLRFSKGSKTLYQAPFDPASLMKESFVAQLPSAVLETLSAGDDVKWGLYFSDKKVKDVVATFKVIDKQQATKEIAKKIDGNKSLASTPTIRELARAEILMNYSLYSEVVEVLSEVAASDKTLTAPYLPLANALRRLKLKDSPLFQESLARASFQTPRGRGLAGGPGNGPGAGGPEGELKNPGGAAVTPGRAGIAKSAGNAKPGLKMGGSVPPGLREVAPNPNANVDPATLPPNAQAAWQTYQGALAAMRQRTEMARRRAEEMRAMATKYGEQAAAATAAANAAQAALKDLEKALQDAVQALEANPNDPALQQQVAQLGQQVTAALENLQKLQKEAAEAQLRAEKADKAADNAEKQAEATATALPPTTVNPGNPTAVGPVPPVKPDDKSGAPGQLTFEQAAQNLAKAYEGVAAAQQAVQDALAAVGAADALMPNASTPEEILAAQQAHDAAWQAYQDALAAEAQAVAAAEAAEHALNKSAK